MMKIAALGEVMLELQPGDTPEQFKLGIGGDTYNTAVMLSRQGVATGYITRLGRDHFSQQIVGQAQTEQLDTRGIVQDGDAMPGLYLIQNDDAGEREFFYWRDNSPARRLFESPAAIDALLTALQDSEWLYLSGITVAVMGQHQEAHFLGFLKQVKAAGIRIAFDPNYRPRLWSSTAIAKQWHDNLLSLSDMVLPTLADEQALWKARDAETVIARCREAGAKTVVVKCPEACALGWHEGESAECQSQYTGPVIDTTGAGDAFNAGFLAAILAGNSLPQSLAKAHSVASKVLSVRGALP